MNYIIKITIKKFAIWFACSLVGLVFLTSLVPNYFISNFIVALIISFVAINEK